MGNNEKPLKVLMLKYKEEWGEDIIPTCPNCREELVEDTVPDWNYCAYCGQRIVYEKGE